jgi:hypothetical protein
VLPVVGDERRHERRRQRDQEQAVGGDGLVGEHGHGLRLLGPSSDYSHPLRLKPRYSTTLGTTMSSSAQAYP